MGFNSAFKVLMNVFTNKKSCAVADIGFYLFIYISVLFGQFVVLRENTIYINRPVRKPRRLRSICISI